MGEITNLNQIVAEIKFFENQAVVSYWEIGKRLSQAKEQVNHGEWMDWVSNNLGYSQRTTNSLMKVYKEIPNSQAIANLSYTKVVNILSLPEEDRQNFIDSHEVEDMTTRQLQAEIKEYKEGLEEKEKQLEESAAANKRLADKVIELEQREPEIIEKEVIPEDYKDLQDELKELMAYQKELENKLYELQKEPKEEVKEVIKEVDRADIRYYKSEIKRLKDDLQKEITKNLSLINDKKLAISQLETEEAHRKRVSDITSMHYSIAGFLRSIGGQLYLTEYLEEVTPRERNLYLDSVKHLREFSEQLYLNCEEAIKKYRG
ncbi:DUF3102 domain-containing protein [Anaerococcus sp. NML200537]|uniref:DUF3102 domain-containing protein n=1 Tax=Anaerococcus sp. NML200537 TaxID=2954485 RepID=UPI002237D93D|nr:DUF3102 domain-containing protein [Anaerococcus sp. NML200537]MCW6701449.1 DUF3102 domain-containing protein [Anaerococcus sp. NML200537]